MAVISAVLFLKRNENRLTEEAERAANEQGA